MRYDFKPPRGGPPQSASRRRIPVVRFLLVGWLGWWVYSHQEQWRPWLEQVQTEAIPVAEKVEPRLQKPPIKQKTFTLSQGFEQNSYAVANAQQLQNLLDDSILQPWSRLILSMSNQCDSSAFPASVDCVYGQKNPRSPVAIRYQCPRRRVAVFAVPQDSDKVVWINADNGCLWGRVCPTSPLEAAAVPIGVNFDFNGREYLYTRDEFRGIGEAPVRAVLPGVVRDISRDSLGRCITLDHGGQLMSSYWGLHRTDSLEVGMFLHQGEKIGHLAALDTAVFLLRIRQVNRFVRWPQFWQASHPVSMQAFAKFRKEIGL